MDRKLKVSLVHWESQLRERILRSSYLQTWENHLDYRLPELRTISEFIGLESLGDFLEVGCGNGIGSAYFSKFCRRVVATDLADEDPSKHAIGLGKVEQLFQVTGITNGEILGCSADDLPFEAETFDTVFSLYNLEHLPNREKALRECLRVLRPNGKFIAAVPAAGWALFYPIEFYSELGKRVLQRLRPRRKKQVPAKERLDPEGSTRVVKDWRSFRKVYPHFPLPKPHGEYPSYFQEFKSQFPYRWVELLGSTGFSRVSLHPISVIPRDLLVRFMGRYGKRLFKKCHRLDRALCRSGRYNDIAQFVCLIGSKS